MLERMKLDSREDWLEQRVRQGIGGSEAAAVVGMSPFMTTLDLWREKHGVQEHKDLSDNAAVQQGVMMESPLREFYIATHHQYQLDYNPYDILFQSERKWLFATLDGELTDEHGRMGILEIKTATPNGKQGWLNWADGQMPQHYYIQTLHQLLSTGYDFVRLFACLYSMNGDMTLREYEIERCEVEADMQWLLEKETAFYEKNIIGGAMPSTTLML